MHSNRRITSGPGHRRGQFEQLENRLLLDGNPSIGLAEPYLTLSFAPDGVDVAGRPSRLAATFDQVAPTAVWQDAILRAFQTWAVHTNADVGLVADSGLPLGTTGATSRDRRFGDVRIAGAELPQEVGAISVSITSLVGGTWSGDVVFNTAFAYRSVDDIFAIALHEAGNVFGLLDNTDPNSPLNTGPIPSATVPTANDIALLQSLHGQRAADINELEDDNEVERNDRRNDATDLVSLVDEGQPSGAFPALAYGDIQSHSDIDYFKLDIPAGYTGPLTVSLRTSGVSLLRGLLSIENEMGVEIASAAGAGVRGDLTSLTIPTVQAGSELFVRVESGATDLYGIGGYSLIAVFDAANIATPLAIDAATDGSLRRIEVQDLANVFAAEEVRFASDLGTNNSLASATPLSSAAGFVEGSRFEVLASIDPGDQDFYRLNGIDTSTGNTLMVAVRSLNVGRLVPDVSVFNSVGLPLTTTVLANGSGQQLLQVDLDGSSGEVFVQVAASDLARPFASGNYVLQAGVTNDPVTLSPIASGRLVDQSSEQVRKLYVAEPQLFHFVVDALPTAVGTTTAVEFSIRGANGHTTYKLTAAAGASRSAAAAFLPVGEYELVARAIALVPSASFALDYTVRGRAFSDPFVGDGGDPTTNPFVCAPGSGFYCYPGEIVSTDPVLVDPQADDRPVIGSDQTIFDLVRSLVGDWWNWVWATSSLNTTPVAMDDFVRLASSAGSTGSTVAPVNVLGNDIDADYDPLVAVVTRFPARGELSWNPDGSFAYRANSGFTGFDSFNYVAFDFGVASPEATVTIEVVANGSPAGNYNDDDVVDQWDHLVWRSEFGAAGGTADGNSDGVVDAADFTVMRDNLGATRSAALLISSAAAVAATVSSEAPAPANLGVPMLQGLELAAALTSRTKSTAPYADSGRQMPTDSGGRAKAAAEPGPDLNAARDFAFSVWSPSNRSSLAESDANRDRLGGSHGSTYSILESPDRVGFRPNVRQARR